MDKMKFKKSYFIKTTAGKISIVLTILFLVTFFAGLFLGIKCTDPICKELNAFLLGLSGNIFGLILTVYFIQRLMDSAKDKNKRQEENKKILRYHRIMELYISQYKRHFSLVITPLEKQVTFQFNNIEESFAFKDMCYLHGPSLLLSDPFLEQSRISLFYKSEKAIVDFLKKMVEEIDFKYNDSLYSVINDFLDSSIRLDVSGGILQNEHLFEGEGNNKRKMSDIVEEYIKEDEKHNWVNKISIYNYSGDFMGPYVTLYRLLIIERQQIIKYESEIDKIKKCTNIEK